MSSLRALAGLRWSKIVAVLCLATFLATVLVSTQMTKPAEAINNPGQCEENNLTQAIREVAQTNKIPPVYENGVLARACDPKHYGYQPGMTLDQAKAQVTPVLDRCGTNNKKLVVALLEITDILPAQNGWSCNRSIYDNEVQRLVSGQLIDWDRTHDDDPNSPGKYGYHSIESAINLTFARCSNRQISHAVLEATGQLPNMSGSPSFGHAYSSQYSGQCYEPLYDHTDGRIIDGTKMLKLVAERAGSTAQCDDSWITNAYLELTGWNPVVNSERNDCDTSRYGGDSWSIGNYQELKDRVFHSWLCKDPWINQIYQYNHQRRAKGFGTAGECNPINYGNGSWSGYSDLQSKMGVTQTSLANAGIRYRSNGDIESTATGTLAAPASGVYLLSDQGLISNGRGDTLTKQGGDFISKTKLADLGGNSQIVTGGVARIIAAGGGNIIAAGAGT